jgi:hypothetical protein
MVIFVQPVVVVLIAREGVRMTGVKKEGCVEWRRRWVHHIIRTFFRHSVKRRWSTTKMMIVAIAVAVDIAAIVVVVCMIVSPRVHTTHLVSVAVIGSV